MINRYMLSVARMHLKDRWSWIILPWVILLSSFVINLLIAGIAPMEEEGLTTGGLSSMFVYFFVGGIVSLVQMYPFALGFNVRRKDFFWGTAIAIGLVSVCISIALVLLAFIENTTDGWFVNLHFFVLPYFSDGNVLAQLWIYLLLLLFLFYAGFTISSIYRKFGRNGMYAFFLILALAFTVIGYAATYYGWWADLAHWVSDYSMLGLANWTLLPTAVFLAASYSLLRRATV